MVGGMWLGSDAQGSGCNRLTSVVLPGAGGTVTFKYNPLGGRIQKSTSSSTTNYLHDGGNAEFFAEQENPPGSAGLDFDLVFRRRSGSGVLSLFSSATRTLPNCAQSSFSTESRVSSTAVLIPSCTS
jgi:hypothetical protein